MALMVHASYWLKGISIRKANQHVQVSESSTQGSYHSPQVMVASCYPRCRLGSWSSTAVQSLLNGCIRRTVKGANGACKLLVERDIHPKS